MPAIAVGLDRLKPARVANSWNWVKPLLLAVALFVCNLFPSPSGPYISPRNQNKRSMTEAMNSLLSMPANSVILTDFQGRLVLNYYLCAKSSDVPCEPTKSLLQSRCGNYNLITSATTQQGFERSMFPGILGDAWQLAPTQETLWLFQTGWIDDKETDWIAELRTLGCTDPRNFGPNILICPLTDLP
jgi:hypothetical protein